MAFHDPPLLLPAMTLGLYGKFFSSQFFLFFLHFFLFGSHGPELRPWLPVYMIGYGVQGL